jgi:hypothetical protein
MLNGELCGAVFCIRTSDGLCDLFHDKDEKLQKLYRARGVYASFKDSFKYGFSGGSTGMRNLFIPILGFTVSVLRLKTFNNQRIDWNTLKSR